MPIIGCCTGDATPDVCPFGSPDRASSKATPLTGFHTAPKPKNFTPPQARKALPFGHMSEKPVRFPRQHPKLSIQTP
jgi:hypothetical protein